MFEYFYWSLKSFAKGEEIVRKFHATCSASGTWFYPQKERWEIPYAETFFNG
jgi:hypothetical protein